MLERGGVDSFFKPECEEACERRSRRNGENQQFGEETLGSALSTTTAAHTPHKSQPLKKLYITIRGASLTR